MVIESLINMIFFLLTNILNGLLGIGLLLLGYRIFSWYTQWSFREALNHEKNGITPGSIVIAAFFIALSLIIMAAAF